MKLGRIYLTKALSEVSELDAQMKAKVKELDANEVERAKADELLIG